MLWGLGMFLAHRGWRAVALAALLPLGGCLTQLAPSYDPTIANALSGANSDIQALFVSIGTDADASSFPTRKYAYDNIVAELSATLIEIKARPIPDPEALDKAEAALRKVGVDELKIDPGFSAYPSARSVSDLIDTMKRMEGFDQQSRLHKEAVPEIERQANIYLIQAITYENFLKR